MQQQDWHLVSFIRAADSWQRLPEDAFGYNTHVRIALAASLYFNFVNVYHLVNIDIFDDIDVFFEEIDDTQICALNTCQIANRSLTRRDYNRTQPFYASVTC